MTELKNMSVEDLALIQMLAQDLVDMHNDEGINLEYWPCAREFVTRWHTGDTKATKRRGWHGIVYPNSIPSYNRVAISYPGPNANTTKPAIYVWVNVIKPLPK
jgi:hypothetical protein